MKNYVAYYRVSTKQQGASGLGLESQKSIVASFVKNDNGLIVNEFTEVESGKNDKRPKLLAALKFAKENDATLIIAKLDRLSRNASFVIALRDSGVKFTCCDMPDANNFTIGIFALLAQQERELISARTKAALQAKKERGFKLGSPGNFTDAGRKLSIDVRMQNAKEDENNKKAALAVKSLRTQNKSFRQIAKELNENGYKTRRGKLFQATTVKRLLDN